MRYPTIQKQLIAIIDSLHFFEAQLGGYRFVIVMHHKPLFKFVRGEPAIASISRIGPNLVRMQVQEIDNMVVN